MENFPVLSDVIPKLDSLNRELQDENKDIAHMISSVSILKCELDLQKSFMTKKSSLYFQNVKK